MITQTGELLLDAQQLGAALLGISTALSVSWGAAILIGLVLLVISAARVLSNGAKTARAFSDSALRRRATMAAVAFWTGLVGTFTFPVVGVIAGFVWPLWVASLERRLVVMDRGTHPSYRRSLTVALLLLGVSVLLGSGYQVIVSIGARPWEASEGFAIFFGLWLVLLSLLIGNGVTMLVGAARLVPLWNTQFGKRIQLDGSASVPAGWYPDSVTGGFRYWDGTNWTEQVQPGRSGV